MHGHTGDVTSFPGELDNLTDIKNVIDHLADVYKRQAVGGNNLGIVVFVTMIFSVAQAIVNVLLLEGLPSELVNIIPYVSVLVILIIIGIRTKKQLKAKA